MKPIDNNNLPRSVELNQNILVVVEDEVGEGLALEHHNVSSGIFGGHLLRLQGRLEVASQE